MAASARGRSYVPDTGDVQPGAVLSDQVKSLDWKVRRAKKKGALPETVVAEVRAKIKALLLIK